MNKQKWQTRVHTRCTLYFSVYFCITIVKQVNKLWTKKTTKTTTSTTSQACKTKKLKHKTFVHFLFQPDFFILFFILQFNNITHVIEYNYFDLVKKTVIHRWHSSKTNEKRTQKRKTKTGSEIPILAWVAAAAAESVLVSLEFGQQRAHFEIPTAVSR